MKEYFVSVACMHTGEFYGVVILHATDEFEACRRAISMVKEELAFEPCLHIKFYEFYMGTHPPERMNRVVGKEEALSWGGKSLRDEAIRSMN